MRASVRRAATSDVQDVVELIRAYASEVHGREAAVTPEALLDDGFGSVLEFYVAEASSGRLAGFAAWEKTYDVISGRRGGVLLGLYVEPRARGHGTGHALVTAVANEVRGIGGTFLLGAGGAYVQLVDEVVLAQLLRVNETPQRGSIRSPG